MIVPESFRYVIILVLMCVHKSITAPTSDAPSSASCSMDTSNTTLDCSNLGLTAIPNNIPNTILILKMNFNNLVHLTEEAFGTDMRQLTEINLSNNEISNINRRAFKNLENLTSINLSKNNLNEFNPATFSELKNLKSLDLSYNKIKLQDSFIVQQYLSELNLDHCGFDEIPSDAFASVPSLENLSLEGNPLNNLDASAFEHLENVIRLRIHNLSRELIAEICLKLEKIDAIEFDGYNVSCFVLTAHPDDFNSAIVQNDKPLALPVHHATTTTQKPTTTTTTEPVDISTLIPILNHTAVEASKIPEHITVQTSTTTEVNSAVVDVDSATIKYMLIGILAVTLVGIAVGLICRADVCSIKTVLCRSNKNRARKPEDSVSPFEEIPLNTVNSNGSGKNTNEG